MIGSHFHINFRWPSAEPDENADFDCVIQRDLWLDPATLQDFSAKILTPIEQDLVMLVGAIAYADRVVRRRRSRGWTRNLALTIPVNSPSHWGSAAVSNALLDAIEYVTGDAWNFEFVQGPSRPLVDQQSSLDFTRGNYVVIPFSDGLDSFLQWQLLNELPPVSTGHPA